VQRRMVLNPNDSGCPLKHYDQGYFDRWYRGDEPVKDEGELRRLVALAVAAAESILNRPIETVLDIGCGEGRWQPILQESRPGASYIGLDPSEYAVERWGAERNLRIGGLETLEDLDHEDPFDLVICADVLHYLDKETILLKLDELADLVGGVALIEVFAEGDTEEGDREGFNVRPASWYRSVFEGAGLVPIGMQLYVHRDLAEDLDALELPGAGLR